MKKKYNLVNIIVLILITCVGFAAAARPKTVGKVVSLFVASARDAGTIKVEVVEVGEPVYRPMQMTVSVHCQGRPVEIVRQDSICDYRQAKWDERSKILIIRYSTSEFTRGQAKCNSHWTQPFDLRELCASEKK